MEGIRVYSDADVAECLGGEESAEVMDGVMGFMDEHGCDLGQAFQILLAAGLARYTEAGRQFRTNALSGGGRP